MFKLKRKKESTEKVEGFMHGVIALMFSQVIIKILGLVYKWYLTNKEGFGDEGNAIYSAGFGIYALLLTISSTGVPNAVAKLVSEHNAKGDYRGAHRVFKISLITFAIIGLIGTLILFLGAHYISNVLLSIPDAELTLVALSPAIFFVSIISVFRGYFNGRQNMKATANSQTLEQLCKTIFTILPLITIVFTISFPSMCFITFSSFKAFSLIISSESSIPIFIVALTFPFTCTAISISSSTSFDSSYLGHSDLQTGSPKAYCSFNSSAKCGANGYKSICNTL